MDILFVKLLNMSIAASWLILAVIILRVLLKKAPKWINCILWGIVAVRLVCPFSFESILSLIPSAETINSDIVRYSEKPMIDSGVSIINHSINPFISENFAPAIGDSANPLYIWTYIAGIIWSAGLGCLLIYALISFLRLHRKVSEAVPLQDNVWQADTVKSPFILGIVSPKIYISSSTGENQLDYILAHEQAHIKRKDHIWKFLGYLLLAVYWFNPLSWAAYILFCRDIELACDEKVICGYDEEEKVKYSNTLLCCSMQRKLVISCPLAFGEVAVKERVKSVMKYKKPAFWILCASVIVCIIVAVCFLTNPVTSNAESGEITYANENTSDLPPMIIMLNNKYVAPYRPVNELPEGYEYMGELTDTEANDTGLSGCKYYVNKYLDSFNDFYVYQECGIPVDENTVDTTERQWAYVQWIRSGIKNIIEGDFKTYYEMKDGTWSCDGQSYKYRLVITGRMPNAEKDSTFVFLSNIEEISFRQAFMASGFSSNMDDYFKPEEAVFIGYGITSTETGVEQTTAYGSAYGADGSTFEEVFSKYVDYGITYVEAANASGAGNVYYNGQLVNRFSDVTPDGSAFSFQSGEKSGINVRTVYGSNGKITGIEIVQ